MFWCMITLSIQQSLWMMCINQIWGSRVIQLRDTDWHGMRREQDIFSLVLMTRRYAFGMSTQHQMNKIVYNHCRHSSTTRDMLKMWHGTSFLPTCLVLLGKIERFYFGMPNKNPILLLMRSMPIWKRSIRYLSVHLMNTCFWLDQVTRQLAFGILEILAKGYTL